MQLNIKRPLITWLAITTILSAAPAIAKKPHHRDPHRHERPATEHRHESRRADRYNDRHAHHGHQHKWHSGPGWHHRQWRPGPKRQNYKWQPGQRWHRRPAVRSGYYHHRPYAWRHGYRLPNRRWLMGRPLPRRIAYHRVHPRVLRHLRPAPRGHRYVRVDNDILLISRANGLVVDALLNY